MKKYKRKDKKKVKVVPKEKKGINGKFLARFLWAIILCWLVLTGFSFIRMNAMMNTNAKLQKEITEIQENTKNVNLLNQDSSLDLFLKRYVTNYLTINDNADQMDNRLKILESMSAKGLEYPNQKLESGSQSLVSITPFDYEFHEDYDLAKYNVTYRLTAGEQEKTYAVAINIPVQRKEDKKYLVVAEPFITSFDVNDLNSVGDRLDSSLRKQEKISDSNQLALIQSFLEQFLMMYQEGNIDQLQYLMATPEGLNGQYEIYLDRFDAYGTNENPAIDAYIQLRQKDTSVSYKQQMRFDLETRDGKYFVQMFNQIIN